ncbi:MAG TPA: hypothetical protein VN375_19210 [Vicinamibacteria bacterium]|jgi:hypothetical protein|nr:hypothetical protein [Vicinamibacteria bacterium]
MADVIDLANDTVPSTYAGIAADDEWAPPVAPEIPLTKSGKPDGRSRAAREARGQQPTAPGKKPTPAASRKGARDYRKGIEGIGQLVAGGLMFVAPADAAAVGFHTPPIAEALNDLAQEDPRFAAMLDKLMKVGPYSALLAAVAPLMLQILCNHGKMPAGILGTVPPEHLIEAFIGAQGGQQ